MLIIESTPKCPNFNFQWLSAEENLKKHNNLSQEDYDKFIDNCKRENQHEILELFYELKIMETIKCVCLKNISNRKEQK